MEDSKIVGFLELDNDRIIPLCQPTLDFVNELNAIFVRHGGIENLLNRRLPKLVEDAYGIS